jgi:hypothetical protein
MSTQCFPTSSVATNSSTPRIYVFNIYLRSHNTSSLHNASLFLHRSAHSLVVILIHFTSRTHLPTPTSSPPRQCESQNHRIQSLAAAGKRAIMSFLPPRTPNPHHRVRVTAIMGIVTYSTEASRYRERAPATPSHRT